MTTTSKATTSKATTSTTTEKGESTMTTSTTLQEALDLIARAKEKDIAADRAAINVAIAVGNVIVSDAKPQAFLELAQASMDAAKAKNRTAYARFQRVERLVYYGVFCATQWHEKRNADAIAYRQATCADPLQHSFFLNGMPTSKDLVKAIRQAWRENWNSFRPLIKAKTFSLWQDPIKLERVAARRSTDERGQELANKLASFLKAENMTIAQFCEKYMAAE